MYYHVRQMAHPFTAVGKKWKFPVPPALLDPIKPRPMVSQRVQQQAEYLEQILTHGRTTAQVKRTVAGPFVTQFWIDLKTRGGKSLTKPGEYFWKHWKEVRPNAITRDLQLSSSPRVVAPTNNQLELLLEFKNDGERDVHLREVIESDAFQKSTAPLTIPLGLDAAGNPAVADLSVLPHLLITGTTGAGKSVFLDGLILGLTFNHSPNELQFIMMGDLPEMIYFRNLPHLLGPIYYFEDYGTEVLNILKWLEVERDARLSAMKAVGFDDFDQYNLLLQIRHGNPLPRIVVVVEHFFSFGGARDWDSTLPTLKEVDPIFLRLVQTAHPAGIHLVITHQTPSHQEMSIPLKESFRAQIGFAQNHPDFSMMVLGVKDAAQLAFHGDMLFRKNQDSAFERYQACNVSQDEALRVVNYWRAQV